MKKILNLLILFGIMFSFVSCPSFADQSIEAKKRKTREKINHLQWLENLEKNKLYKNQQKL